MAFSKASMAWSRWSSSSTFFVIAGLITSSSTTGLSSTAGLTGSGAACLSFGLSEG
jgi:hypothetical protein